MVNTFEIYVMNGIGLNKSIYVIKPLSNGKAEAMWFEDGKEVIKQFDASSALPLPAEIKPLLSIPMDWEISFQFSSKLAQKLIESGVQIPDKNFAQGKLEATEKHLEDMRTLLFKEKN